MSRIAFLLMLSLALGLPASAFTVDWVTVGDPGNACETQAEGCFGAVANGFRIGKYEVTNAQYAEFLNAVAVDDTNGLYNTDMGFDQILRGGAPGNYTYTAFGGNENKPITSFSFYDALRFANWLHNGQPSTGAQDASTTEDGAYLFTGPSTVGARKVSAQVFLPTENEWYKAAYYNAGSASYFDYPAGSNTQTTCSAPTATPNRANCSSASMIFAVGSYTGSPSPYVTFDQGGNVWEWNETIISGGRGVRGGTCCTPFADPTFLAAATRFSNDPLAEENLVGFRVAPEPGSLLQLACGSVALLGLARKTRRRIASA